MDGSMFFTGWGGLARVLVVGVLAYASLVAMLRVSGNRTLSKMNAFDLVVTMALGSTLATVLVSQTVALAEGVVALLLLIGLQYVVTWLSVRWSGFSETIKAEPVLLVYQGRLLRGQMRRARVVEDEVLAALRGQGVASASEVEALLLETDGSFNVVRRTEYLATTLRNVSLPEHGDASGGPGPPSKNHPT